jgi:hypothetical protein
VWLEVDRVFSHSFLAFASDAEAGLKQCRHLATPNDFGDASPAEQSVPEQRDAYVGELGVRADHWAHVEPPHGTPKLVR